MLILKNRWKKLIRSIEIQSKIFTKLRKMLWKSVLSILFTEKMSKISMLYSGCFLHLSTFSHKFVYWFVSTPKISLALNLMNIQILNKGFKWFTISDFIVILLLQFLWIFPKGKYKKLYSVKEMITNAALSFKFVTFTFSTFFKSQWQCLIQSWNR